MTETMSSLFVPPQIASVTELVTELPRFASADVARIIRQLALGSPRVQGLRELLQNGLEARATRIDIAPWNTEAGHRHLTFVDDGCGMTADQLHRLADLAYSGEYKTSGNFGMGAKVANICWNILGMTYVSSRDGETNQMTLQLTDRGIMCTPQRLSNRFWMDSQIRHLPSVKSIIKHGHGTMVRLNGSANEPDSFSSWARPMSADREVSEWNESRTLAVYLNNKFLEFGDGTCTIKYWWESPDDGEEHIRPSNRLIKGHYASIDSLNDHGKVVRLDVRVPDCDFIIYYADDIGGRGLNAAAQHYAVFGGRGDILGNGGLVSIALNGEVYGEMKTGSKASTFLKALGIWLNKLHKNIMVIVLPNPAKCRPNPTRTGLEWHDGGDPTALPIEQFQEEFRKNLPDFLANMLNQEGSLPESADLTKDLRDYAKDMLQPESTLMIGDGEGGRGVIPRRKREQGTKRNVSEPANPRTKRRKGKLGDKRGTRCVVKGAAMNITVAFDTDPNPGFRWGDYASRGGQHVIVINPSCLEIARIRKALVVRHPKLAEEQVRQVGDYLILYAIGTKIVETIPVLPKDTNPTEKLDDFFLGGLLRGADTKEGIISFVSKRLARMGAAPRKR